MTHKLNLVCPYCGSEIWVELSHVSYSGEEFENIVCENYRCDATWARDGEARFIPEIEDPA